MFLISKLVTASINFLWQITHNNKNKFRTYSFCRTIYSTSTLINNVSTRYIFTVYNLFIEPIMKSYILFSRLYNLQLDSSIQGKLLRYRPLIKKKKKMCLCLYSKWKVKRGMRKISSFLIDDPLSSALSTASKKKLLMRHSSFSWKFAPKTLR